MSECFVKQTSLIFCQMKIQQKDSHLQNGKRPSPNTEPVSALILDFPALKTERNKY